MAKSKPYLGTIYRVNKTWHLQYFTKNAANKRIRVRESLKTGNREEAVKEAARRTEFLTLKSEGNKLEKKLRERVATVNEKARYLKAQQSRIPLTEVWQRFPYDTSVRGNVRRPLKPKVILKHQQLWDAFLKWMATSRPDTKFFEEVTEADTLAYSDYCRKRLNCGPRGHNDRIKICRVICGLAGIKPNPFSAVKKWAEVNESRECLELVDLQKIMDVATGEMRLLVMIGLFTGLRLGDAATLRWRDIKDGRVYKVTGKTGKPVSLAIAPPLQAALPPLPRQSSKQIYIMPGLAELYLKEPQALCKRVRHLFESAGIEVVENIPGRARAVSRRGFHSLRTSFVSVCARAGVPTELISQWAGHSPQVNAIYQKFGNAERDARILGALNQVATVTRPSTSLPLAIDVDATEVQTLDAIRLEINQRLALADRETVVNILTILRTN